LRIKEQETHLTLQEHDDDDDDDELGMFLTDIVNLLYVSTKMGITYIEIH